MDPRKKSHFKMGSQLRVLLARVRQPDGLWAACWSSSQAFCEADSLWEFCSYSSLASCDLVPVSPRSCTRQRG